MTQYAIVTDLNRCVDCLACTAACKTRNEVNIGQFRIKVLRVGPTLVDDRQAKGGMGCETYFLPMTCQHCEAPTCVDVCPTGASYKAEDGTVQIDPETCIGCESCMNACPYDVRFKNAETNIVDKCDMCADRIANGLLPACVQQCGGRARWFGDLEGDLGDFEGPADAKTFDYEAGSTYEEIRDARIKLKDYVVDWNEQDVHFITDEGNGPCNRFILRGRTWQSVDYRMPSNDWDTYKLD